jgi:SAM-dependent methyltransferase
MTWEETIIQIRKNKEYHNLVTNSYLLEDLVANVNNYKNSDEFKYIIEIIKKNVYSNEINLLDVGSGNGITAICFALMGFSVTAVEPDKSLTVGCGAIEFLKQHYQLSNLTIYSGFCEDINFASNVFNVSFARQCMHHAYDLNKFVQEMSRVLIKGGLFLTVRDHVVFSENDKRIFLESHPLQKFYFGENAFTRDEYKNAIFNAGLILKHELKYYDSVINFFPNTEVKVENLHKYRLEQIKESIKLKFKFGHLIIYHLYLIKNRINKKDTYSESKIPGRMYSYIAIKK